MNQVLMFGIIIRILLS